MYWPCGRYYWKWMFTLPESLLSGFFNLIFMWLSEDSCWWVSLVSEHVMNRGFDCLVLDYGLQPFRHQRPASWKIVFPWTGGRGYGFRVSQAHYIYCVLTYYYYISSTSDHQVLDPGVWEPCLHYFSRSCIVSSLRR